MWKKIRMWFYLQFLGAQEDVYKAVRKGIKEIKKENQEACDHPILKQIIPKDMWYRCTNKKCQIVFQIHSASGWNKKQIPILIKGLEEGLNIKREK